MLQLTYGKTSFILTGDMEEDERATLPSFPRATVLKAAHHGSSNGIDAAFLRAISPRFAIISVAAHNTYGHPHRETMTLLRNAKVRTYTTATSGTVVLWSDGNAVTVKALGASHAATGATPAGSVRRSTAPQSARQSQCIGNLRSLIFHRPSCSTLPAGKNRAHFASRNQAFSQGYRPCRRCNP